MQVDTMKGDDEGKSATKQSKRELAGAAMQPRHDQ